MRLTENEVVAIQNLGPLQRRYSELCREFLGEGEIIKACEDAAKMSVSELKQAIEVMSD